MGSSYHSSSDSSSSSSLTLDSFFGIKGSVRLVPQGASQKPHLVFRRECSPGYGDELGSLAGKARFSLVANKRFTIPKGHALSFGIVDPRGDDEVKPLNGESTFTLEFDYDDELHSRKDFESLPAKMRKSLTGVKTFDMFAERQTPNSLGFPGYPLPIPETRVFASASVQTDPIDLRGVSSPLTRTPSPVSLTKGKDKYPPRVYPSPISTVDHPTEDSLFLADTSIQDKEDELEDGMQTDGSSSMDLSTPASLNNSPVILSHRGPSLTTEPDLDKFALPPACAGTVEVRLGTCGLQAPEEMSSPFSVSKRRCEQPKEEEEPTKSSIEGPLLSASRILETLSQEKILNGLQDVKTKVNPPSLVANKLPPKPNVPTSSPVLIPDVRKSTATREVLPIMPRAMSQRISLPGSGLTTSPSFGSSINTAVASSSATNSCPPGNKSGPTATSAPRSTLPLNGLLPVKPQVPNIPTPHPTISNPLGIRPSASILPKRLPTGPKSLLGSLTTTINPTTQPSNGTAAARTLETPPTRKPVVVSANWSALRGSAPLGSVNPTTSGSTVPSRLPASRSISMAKSTTIDESLLTPLRQDLSALLRYSASPPWGVPSNPSTSVSANARPLPAFVRSNNSAMQGQASPELTVETAPRQDFVQEDSSDSKGKWKRVIQEEHDRSILKRSRGEVSEGKGSVLGNAAKDDPHQPRKKVKTEDSLTLLQDETCLVRSLSTESGSSLWKTDIEIDETLRQSKDHDVGHDSPPRRARMTASKRRRERQKASKLHHTPLPYGDDQALENEESEKDVEGVTYVKEQQRIHNENLIKANEERENKARQLAEKAKDKEVQAAKLSEAENRTAPVSLAPKGQQLPRLTHPLPPKPQIVVTPSSYRPTVKRERDRSRGRDYRRSRSKSPSHSGRSQSRSRSRGGGRGRSHSRNGIHDLSVDKRAKVSESHSGQGHDSTTAIESIGSVTWPMTSPIMEHQIQGARPVAIRQISFTSDGKRVGIVCSDKTIRLWDTKPRIAEAAQLLHSANIMSMSWMEYNKGILTLCDDGSLNSWLLKGKEWQHNKLFHTTSMSSGSPVAMAYRKDRIAVSTTSCVKVWLHNNGIWQAQREIKRSGVTALRFHLDGGLFGGCKDGTVWYCEVPNGTLRVYHMIANHWTVTSIDVHPNGVHILAGQKGGSYLISHKPNTLKGQLDRIYVTPGPPPASGNEGVDYSSIFVTNGQAVVSGLIKGCALVWDRKKGNIVYGLRHPHDDTVHAIAAFDGQPGVEGMMVSGTRQGRLFWWPIPQAAPSGRYPSNITSANPQ